MRILIVEDHKHKIEELTKFLDENYDDSIYEVRMSYNSGLKEIIQRSGNYDLVLLDMSMHNYDISRDEPGGDPIPLAGELILNQMYNRGIRTKVIVVTMFETFANRKIDDLHESLKGRFSDFYLGYVFFSASEGTWKKELKQLMAEGT